MNVGPGPTVFPTNPEIHDSPKVPHENVQGRGHRCDGAVLHENCFHYPGPHCVLMSHEKYYESGVVFRGIHVEGQIPVLIPTGKA